MDAVVQIDVGKAGKHRRAARFARAPGRRVAGGIGLADVRLDLDDHTAGQDAAAVVNQHLAEEIARDVERRPIVELAREFHGMTRRAP